MHIGQIRMSKILPTEIDNSFSGYKISLWFFYLITVMTLVRSLMHILISDGGAQSIATIPLDSFTDTGAAVVVGIFAYWGLSQVMFGVMQLIVAINYKALIPLMYLMLILEWGGRLLLGAYKPIETIGQAPGGIGNLILPIVCLIMFFLSISKSQEF